MRSLLRLADGVLLEHLAHEVLGLGISASLQRGFVVVDVFRVDNDVDSRGVVELFQLLRGELCLGWAAAAKDADGLCLVLLQGLVDVVRDLGDVELVARLREDAGDVEANVAHADDGDLGSGEVPVTLETRVAVVEAHELAGAVDAFEVDAWDVEMAVAHGARREDDSVVVVLEFLDGDVAADMDIGEQTDLLGFHDAVEGLDNALDARVVRSHAVTDEAEGGRHLLDEVNLDVAGEFLDEDVGGVNSGRASANDGDAQG